MSAYKPKTRKQRLMSRARSGMANANEDRPASEHGEGEEEEAMLEGEERVFKILQKEISEKCAQIEERAEKGEVWMHAEMVVRKKRLEKLHGEFQQCFKSVVRIVADNKIEKCRKMASATSTEYENALIMIEVMERQVAEEERQQQPLPVEVERVIRVEQARTPNPGVFNGDPADWPNFRSRFHAEVHTRQFDDATKLMYLLSACVGSAKSSMGDWELTNENYEKAWQVLEERYEDKFRLEQALIAKLIKIEKESEETHVSLRNVIDKTNNTLRQLEAIGTRVDEWDPIVIGLMMAAMPRKTADAWEQHRNPNEQPGLNQLMRFLEQRAKGRVFIESANVETAARQPRPKPSFRFQQRPLGKKPFGNFHARKEIKEERLLPPAATESATTGTGVTCFCCGGPHMIYRCPKFVGMSVDKRMEEANRAKLCLVCLARHGKGSCREKGMCRKCTDHKHSYLLCRRAGGGPKQSDTKRSHDQAFGRQ